MHDNSLTPAENDSAAEKSNAIYLVAAHPHWRESRVNRRMLAAAKQVPGVATLDLYGRYPDYHIHAPAEQARLAAQNGHPLIVFDVPLLVESGARWRARSR